MKKNILLVFMLSLLFSGNKLEKYKIEGMHCSYGCVNKIKSVVNSIEGMKSCEVSFENSLMTVEYDDSKVNSGQKKKIMNINKLKKIISNRNITSINDRPSASRHFRLYKQNQINRMSSL